MTTEYASGSEALRRIEAIDFELEMWERMKDPAYKVNITEYGYECLAALEAERADLIKRYSS